MNLFCNYQSYHTTIHKSKRSNKPLVFVLLISMKAFVFWVFFCDFQERKNTLHKRNLNPKSDWTTTKQKCYFKISPFYVNNSTFLVLEYY